MAAALSRLLSELLLDASTPNRLPEDVRGTLYATVSTALRAFSPQEVQPVLETLVPCAWAEFATPEVPGSKGVAQPAGALKVVQGATTDAKANGKVLAACGVIKPVQKQFPCVCNKQWCAACPLVLYVGQAQLIGIYPLHEESDNLCDRNDPFMTN